MGGPVSKLLGYVKVGGPQDWVFPFDVPLNHEKATLKKTSHAEFVGLGAHGYVSIDL